MDIWRKFPLYSTRLVKAGTPNNYSHLEPWIEIWDRGRSEVYNDQIGDRTMQHLRLTEKPNKVVVTKSGRGYVKGYYIRDIGPKQTGYYADGDFRRNDVARIQMMEKRLNGHVH